MMQPIITASSSERPRNRSAEPPGQEILMDEYEHGPVPQHARRSLRSVSAVWLGFPMIMTSAIFGGLIGYNLGFFWGLVAIIVGNAVLVAYVGGLSYIAGSTGESFSLTARRVFGDKGYLAPAVFLSTLVIGWFALQTGMVGDILHANYGWSTALVALLAGIGFIIVTFLGIRSLAVIGVIGSALFAILGVFAVYFALQGSSFSQMVDFQPGVTTGALSFGACVTIVIACFIDSGTMTADFTRWSRSGKEGFLASLAAFPFGNMFAQLVGLAVVSLGASLEPATSGGDFMHILVQQGGWLVPAALIFVLINMGSVCAHCLYNGAVGYSEVTKLKMRTLTLVLGIIGVTLAIIGVSSYFLVWLDFLGILVPPIGAVILTSVLLTKTSNQAATAVRWRAFAAWAIGASTALFLNFQYPHLSAAVTGIIASALAMVLLDATSSKTTENTTASLDEEAEELIAEPTAGQAKR